LYIKYRLTKYSISSSRTFCSAKNCFSVCFITLPYRIGTLVRQVARFDYIYRLAHNAIQPLARRRSPE
jgi:hypothetical protein